MHVSDGAWIGPGECCSIDPETRWIRSDQIICALVSVNVPRDLIGALTGDVDSGQHVIRTRQNVEWTAALKLDDAGYSPVTQGRIEPVIREFRRIDKAGHVDDVTAVLSCRCAAWRSRTVAPITGSCRRYIKANAAAATI